MVVVYCKLVKLFQILRIRFDFAKNQVGRQTNKQTNHLRMFLKIQLIIFT